MVVSSLKQHNTFWQGHATTVLQWAPLTHLLTQIFHSLDPVIVHQDILVTGNSQSGNKGNFPKNRDTLRGLNLTYVMCTKHL